VGVGRHVLNGFFLTLVNLFDHFNRKPRRRY
jgi:hypothetical protein